MTSMELLHVCQDALPEVPEAEWYALLTAAQEQWMQTVAQVVPASQRAPQIPLMPGAGETWHFPFEPVGPIEVRHGPFGERLRVGDPGVDTTADLTQHGARLEPVAGRNRCFANGLYGRATPTPGPISATQPPVLHPARLRVVLAMTAIRDAAAARGLNPKPIQADIDRTWYGDPQRPGDTGWLGALRNDASPARDGQGGAWWHCADWI